MGTIMPQRDGAPLHEQPVLQRIEEKNMTARRGTLLLSTPPPADCFLWPASDCPLAEHGAYAAEEDVPTIDLSAATKGGSPEEIETLVGAIGAACRGTGFFQVINHGVGKNLMEQVHEAAREFFELPEDAKLAASRAPGSSFGFAGLSAGRFRSKCPWKETLSMHYSPLSNIGEEHLRKIYKLDATYKKYRALHSTYCEAVDKLGKQLIGLIACSLGLPPDSFGKYFARGFSIYRMNMYPPSSHYSRVLGTGPHTDPCALTILHQDEVGGLQIYNNSTWMTVRPRFDALVVSIGDILEVLCNHRYKSAKHRAVVHAYRPRRSIAFFINPGVDEVIRPLPELLGDEPCSQRHMEFRWGQLLEFTQRHYRSDLHTLEAFEDYLKKASSQS